ncbi:hypothetical protein [Streptomyces sp. NBC_00005]|uniref:hypothetical protein n=1 Tax=Streptomyces sp. NBC_00005 TaxID=2903609 RepID=UPI003254A166
MSWTSASSGNGNTPSQLADRVPSGGEVVDEGAQGGEDRFGDVVLVLVAGAHVPIVLRAGGPGRGVRKHGRELHLTPSQTS